MGGTVAASVIQYFFTIVMARLMTPESFGSLASLLSWIAILVFPGGVISMHVARQTAIFLTHNENQKVADLFRRQNYISLIGAIIILAVVYIAVSFEILPSSWPREYVLLMVIIIGFSLLSAVTHGLLQGAQYFTRLSILALIGALLKFFLSGILVSNGYDVFGVAVALAISSFISYLFSWWLAYRVPRPSGKITPDAGFTSNQNNYHYAFYILAALFLLLLLSNIDVILVKHWLDATSAGYYAILSTAGKVIVFGTAAFSGVAFPSAAQTAAAGSGQEKRILLISLTSTVATAAVVITLYILAPVRIISLVFGDEYLPAAVHLGHIGIIASLWAVIQLYVRLLLAAGNRSFLKWLALFITAEIVGITIWHQNISSILTVLFATSALMAASLAFIYQQQIKDKIKVAAAPLNNLTI